MGRRRLICCVSSIVVAQGSSENRLCFNFSSDQPLYGSLSLAVVLMTRFLKVEQLLNYIPNYAGIEQTILVNFSDQVQSVGLYSRSLTLVISTNC